MAPHAPATEDNQLPRARHQAAQGVLSFARRPACGGDSRRRDEATHKARSDHPHRQQHTQTGASTSAPSTGLQPGQNNRPSSCRLRISENISWKHAVCPLFFFFLLYFFIFPKATLSTQCWSHSEQCSVDVSPPLPLLSPPPPRTFARSRTPETAYGAEQDREGAGGPATARLCGSRQQLVLVSNLRGTAQIAPG